MFLRYHIGVYFSRVAKSTARSLRCCGLSFLFWFFLLASVGLAQKDFEITAADTSSPRDTLRSFIESCNATYEIVEKEKYLDPSRPDHAAVAFRILDCLDTSELPAFSREEQAGEVAVCIKEILDRVEMPAWEEIPDVEEIEAAGGYEKLSRWRIPDTRITIARMDEGPQKHEYLFSAGTVSRAVDYYESGKSKPYRTDGPEVSEGFYQWYLSAPRSPRLAEFVDKLPPWIRQGRSFGMARWKWPFLIVAIVIAVGVMTVLYWLYLKLTDNVQHKSLFKYWMTLSLPIFAACVPLGFLDVVHYTIGVRGAPLYLTEFLSIMTALAAAIVVVFAATTRIAETIIASPRINPLGLNAQLIRIIIKILGFMAVVALALYGGQYLGIPVKTLLASAGIGGVALALGAQDTLKDLFGTVSLMADKPFRVGERIILGKYDGVVEDIGLRSTKLRLLTGHLVTLPNDQLARSDIENVGRRPHIRRIADLHLPLDTPRESIENALAIIRSTLEEHEGMDPDFPPRAFFTDYLPTAFNIRVIYWYNPPSYWDFLEMSEKVNLAIFRAFDTQGIQFSLPMRVAHTSVTSQEKPVEVKMV
jgi:MscS family membrane protein